MRQLFLLSTALTIANPALCADQIQPVASSDVYAYELDTV